MYLLSTSYQQPLVSICRPRELRQNKVDMEAPAMSLQEAPDEPARLCQACRKAHFAALRDDDSEVWKEVVNSGTPRMSLHGKMSEQSLPADMWPGLPRLLRSAKSGCGFCALLRKALISTDSRDSWRCCIEGGPEKHGPSQLEFSFPVLKRFQEVGSS